MLESGSWGHSVLQTQDLVSVMVCPIYQLKNLCIVTGQNGQV